MIHQNHSHDHSHHSHGFSEVIAMEKYLRLLNPKTTNFDAIPSGGHGIRNQRQRR